MRRPKKVHLLDDSFWLTKKPYYIYHGGIRKDPINWRLKAKDEWMFMVRDTKLEAPSELFLIKGNIYIQD